MRKRKILLLFFLLFQGIVMCQTWENNFRRLSEELQYRECISIPKILFYNGAIVPVAYGEITYQNKQDSIDTIPFLYYYGRIELPRKDRLAILENKNDSATHLLFTLYIDTMIAIEGEWPPPNGNRVLNVRMSFWCFRNLTSSNIRSMIKQSYWAITSIGDSYKVNFNDYQEEGWQYFNLPDQVDKQSKKNKRMMKRLDLLSRKQYSNQTLFMGNYIFLGSYFFFK